MKVFRSVIVCVKRKSDLGDRGDLGSQLMLISPTCGFSTPLFGIRSCSKQMVPRWPEQEAWWRPDVVNLP